MCNKIQERKKSFECMCIYTYIFDYIYVCMRGFIYVKFAECGTIGINLRYMHDEIWSNDRLLSMGDAPKIYGKRRSIVRRIGSFLPLKPYPKIYVSVTPLHSMSSSMINEDTSNNDTVNVNGFGISDRLSGSKPDLLEPISFGSEVRLLALEQELQELRTQVSLIVKTASQRQHYASMASLSNGNSVQAPPPPPPPLPPPTTPHIARRASLQEHKMEDRKKPLMTQKSMGDMLKDIDKVKLKPIERSPGGRPIRPKRENSPCNDLQEILRKRYVAMRSPDSRNSSTFNIDESFSA